MPGVITSRVGLAIVLALAVLTQLKPIRDLATLVQLGYGFGKTIQPVSDFPYQCRRIHHPLLQACEDMWLSERGRKLYLACSDPYARLQWFPSVDHYNLSGRSQKDAIVVLDVDQPGILAASDSVTVQRLETRDYRGVADDGLLDLNGFTGVDMGNGVVRLLLVNNRASIDPATGVYAADQASVGVNATVEVFEHIDRGGSRQILSHLRTMASPNISTPNRVAAFGSEGFYITNDHGKVKSGGVSNPLRTSGQAMLGKGDVTYCSYDNGCSIVSSSHYYPNGLLLHSDGRLYVPSSARGGVQVYQPQPNGSLQKLADVDAFYAIDNLSEDRNGDIFAAAFPTGVKNQAYVKSPFGPVPPSTVLRIRNSHSGYQWEKVLEDRDGEVLPAATVVVHDASTGRLFLSGASSPFITYCDPKEV
ncbi:hypothetical protein CONLIGDRAFT_656277 [Coniochaeta ligniaria NRRL 30616]|uniref:Calcium-dependent phosphotriesterase n=1 Tax=Coniochaeta ligniaria NRRL 30616 TaxID=1408157 RepID=A0A1J7IIF4_9PEZI|nr:hypothetical protein CONLIGDRAFT_656277 [Coniochaeta ligniaria NRRL 30616]